jgi:hypothetical protein
MWYMTPFCLFQRIGLLEKATYKWAFKCDATFEVLTAVLWMIWISWDVTPCL